MVNDFVKFVPVHEDKRSFESSEQRYDDEVFIVKGPNNSFSDTSILRNELFGNPDYTRHIFSNMGENLYSLDERNIALPIRQFNDISEFGLKYLSKSDIEHSHAQGVFVVERYIINDTYGVNIDSLIRYYKLISDLTKETIQEVIEKIRHCTFSNPVIMRVVTYVPKQDINYCHHVFLPKVNLCIVKGVPNEHVSHPKAVMLRQTGNIMGLLEDDHSTILAIDIVDSKNPFKPYFMVVGNDVKRFISTPSSTKPNGARITMKKDNVLTGDRSDYALNELETIGIYDSEDKALYNGDIDALLTKKKLDLEDSKIELNRRKIITENNKIKMSYEQMDHDMYLAKLEREMKLLTYQTLVFKSEYDYKVSILNIERETILFKQKMQLEENKLRQEDYKMVNTIISFVTSLSKTFSTLI